MKWLTLGIGISLLLTASPAVAGIVYTKVADTGTAIPGGIGSFTTFGNPAIDDGNLAFRGWGDGQEGIYARLGGVLTKVADLNTPIPDGNGNFTGFFAPDIDGDNVVFWGKGVDQEGVYTTLGGSLRKVADFNTPIPEGSGNIASFASLNFAKPAIDNDNIAFRARDESHPSSVNIIIERNGSLTKVVGTDTLIPEGSGNFSHNIICFALSGETVAFRGSSFSGGRQQQGIYIESGQFLRRVADLSTLIPGGLGYFTNLGGGNSPIHVAVDGNNVTFLGEGSHQQGVYLDVGGSISKVADFNTPIPGGVDRFSFFAPDQDSATITSPSLSGENVAFWGAGAEREGIFASIDGTLRIVVERGDVLDGASVGVVDMFRDSFNDDSIAFRASLANSVQGVYVATIDNPVLPQSTVSLDGSGETYWQDFDAVLGPDSNNAGTKLPDGWAAITGGTFHDIISQPFPLNGVAFGTFNVGDGNDRTLATGNTDSSQENQLQLFAEIAGTSEARAVRLAFDVDVDGGPKLQRVGSVAAV